MKSPESMQHLLKSLHCLPVFTKQTVIQQIAHRPSHWIAQYEKERIGLLVQFIERLATHPEVPTIDSALQNLGIPARFLNTPQREAHPVCDQRSFAQCCTDLAQLSSHTELALAMSVPVVGELRVNTWLDWAIERQKQQDFVTALYCAASFWASPNVRSEFDEQWVLMEADSIGVTSMALMLIAGAEEAVKAFEFWLGVPFDASQSLSELRAKLDRSIFGKIAKIDTSAQLMSKMLVALSHCKNDALARAMLMLEAWLDISFDTLPDEITLTQRLRDSRLNDVQSPRLAQQLRTQILELLERARGPREKAVFQTALRKSREKFPLVIDDQDSRGHFLPALLHLQIDHRDGGDEESAAAFAHEYAHFLQTVGTTYNQDRLFDVQNFIAAAVDDLGGHTGAMVFGLSNVESGFVEHLQDHQRSLDGNYPSRAVDEYYEDPSIGLCRLNEESACYEYIRWNMVDRTFFATPLGAHAFQEALIFIDGLFPYLANSTVFSFPDTDPVESAVHVYTAPWELFFRTFEDRNDDSIRKAATLAAILDLSLQLPVLSTSIPRAQWAKMTHPSWRFVDLFQAVRKVQFVDPDEPQDYFRFVDEIYSELQWPSFFEDLEYRIRKFAEIREYWNARLQAALRRHPDLIEQQLAARRSAMGDAMRAVGNQTEEGIQQELALFESAIGGDPLAVLQIFGMGIMDYCDRALQLRLQDPWALILPSLRPEVAWKRLPLPAWFHGEQMRGRWQAESMALLQDINHLRHLFAIALQWEISKKRSQQYATEYVCGFQFFDLPCSDPQCQACPCAKWTPGGARPSTMTSFHHTLNVFELFPG